MTDVNRNPSVAGHHRGNPSPVLLSWALLRRTALACVLFPQYYIAVSLIWEPRKPDAADGPPSIISAALSVRLNLTEANRKVLKSKVRVFAVRSNGFTFK